MTDPLGDRPRDEDGDQQAVDRFALDMLTKLRANSHKAHWRVVTPEWLLGRLREEVEELSDAIDDEFDGICSAETVIRECADVANFALMIADNARRGVGK